MELPQNPIEWNGTFTWGNWFESHRYEKKWENRIWWFGCWCNASKTTKKWREKMPPTIVCFVFVAALRIVYKIYVTYANGTPQQECSVLKKPRAMMMLIIVIISDASTSNVFLSNLQNVTCLLLSLYFSRNHLYM